MRLAHYRAVPLLLIAAATLAYAPRAEAVIRLGRSNPTTLSSGLVGYWTFDGAFTNWTTNTTLDLSGNGNTGTLVAMSTTTSPVAGKIGQALSFAGSSPTITLPIQDISLGTVHSISFWLKAGSSLAGAVLGRFNAGNVSIGFVEFDCALFTYDTATASNCAGVNPGTITDGWHYFTVVRRDTIVTFYKDGASLGSGTLGINENQVVSEISGTGSVKEFLSGSTLDDLRIYNRALSSGEIAQLYHLDQATAGHANTVSVSNGLVGYWPLDGNTTSWTSNTTQDLSGNGNTGQLLSMSTSTSPIAGKIGQALRTSGSSQVTVPISTSLQVANISVSFWGKEGSLVTADADVPIELLINSDGSLSVLINASCEADSSPGLFGSNQWINAVLTYDKTTRPLMARSPTGGPTRRKMSPATATRARL